MDETHWSIRRRVVSRDCSRLPPVFDRMRGDPRGWHAAFHSARDIAEFLVHGRERAYVRHMIDVRIFDPSAISADDFEIYVSAYEAPGAMRAAFEL
jgi:hypothetical protein